MTARKELEKAVTTLNSIIDLTEVNDSENIEAKGRQIPKEEEKSSSQDKIILRALQTIAKNSNFALNKLKKENK